jgi:hypothetical protein
MDEIGSNAPQGQDSTAEHGGESKSSSALTNVTLPKPESPPSPPKPHCSDHHPKPTPWWKRLPLQLLVELAVFIVGVRVACIYSGQLKQMIESNKLTEQTMRLDERAWVAVTAVSGTRPEIRKKITYSVHFIDTGKTPASNVIVHPGDELLTRGKLPTFAIETTPVRLLRNNYAWTSSSGVAFSSARV